MEAQRSEAVKKALAAAVVITLATAMPSKGSTIASIYPGNTASVISSLTGTITEVLNTTATPANTFALDDGTGSVLFYNIPATDFTPVAGENITVTGDGITSIANSPYQDSPELTSTGLTATSFAVNSTGTAPTPPVLTIPTVLAAGTGSVTETAVAPYAEAMVTFDNVFLSTSASSIVAPTTISTSTNTGYYIFDTSNNVIEMYDYKTDSAVLAAATAADALQTASGNTFLSGPVDVTGYVDVYYGVPEIYETAITSVPEPASLGLLGGLVGLLTIRPWSRRITPAV